MCTFIVNPCNSILSNILSVFYVVNFSYSLSSAFTLITAKFTSVFYLYFVYYQQISKNLDDQLKLFHFLRW